MRIESDNPWPVTNDHITFGGPPDACCWCKAKLGQQHKPSCAVRQRTVVCAITIRLVRLVTEDWTPDEIEYGMNHARWCATNILDEFDRLAAHAEHTASGCLCEFFTGCYVREATTEDEEKFGVWVERERKQKQKPASNSAGKAVDGWKRITQIFALG